MRSETFSVWVWFPDGSHICELEDVSAEHALQKARSLALNVGAKIGTTRKITIVDQDDYTVFEWQYERGMVYPTSEMLREAGPNEQ
jgi:hypothetical protein